MGSYNVWMARLDASGSVSWFKPLIGDASSYDQVCGAAFDDAGGFVVTGLNGGAVDFGGGALPGGGGFVAEYDVSGRHLWSRAINATGWGIAYAPAHRVLVSGWFGGTLDLGGGPLVSEGQHDAFLGRFRLP